MNGLRPFLFSAEDKQSLRHRVARHEGAISFFREPVLANLVAALGMQQEVGTTNDELARFVFDAELGSVIARENLRAELVQYGPEVGVRITARGNPPLELRFPHVRELFHPASAPHELVVFPSVVAKFLAAQRVEPVVVVPWALNTIFGGFHPADGFYQTNMWELVNVDVVLYAGLLERRQLAFLGTHDLIAHIAGTQAEAWDELQRLGARVRRRVEGYLAGVATPNLPSLILPYVAGIFLDDLAQPPCYGAASRRIPLEATLEVLEATCLPPAEPLQLLQFPDRFAQLISLARFGEEAAVRKDARHLVLELVREIRSLTWTHGSVSLTA